MGSRYELCDALEDVFGAKVSGSSGGFPLRQMDCAKDVKNLVMRLGCMPSAEVWVASGAMAIGRLVTLLLVKVVFDRITCARGLVSC